MLGYAGYEACARLRPDAAAGPADRTRPARTPAQPQVPIIEHADVKRMLLAQKSYVEGALALRAVLRASGRRAAHRRRRGRGATPRLLLEVLTPIAKSWPSEWCLEANSLAIQVLGGYGYTRDFPVEQYWRDNRLNMIHEGTHGIQALDLLGRKVVMDDGAGLALLRATIEATIAARPGRDGTGGACRCARAPRSSSSPRRRARPGRPASPDEALANATPYLQAFGHVVLAWIWLDVAICAARAPADDAAQRGKLAACRYFFHYELPKIGAWLGVVERRDDTCRTMAEDWF